MTPTEAELKVASEITTKAIRVGDIRSPYRTTRINNQIAQALAAARQGGYEEGLKDQAEADAKLCETADCVSCASEYGGPMAPGDIDYKKLPAAIRSLTHKGKA